VAPPPPLTPAASRLTADLGRLADDLQADGHVLHGVTVHLTDTERHAGSRSKPQLAA
jgi:hypothetical protein